MELIVYGSDCAIKGRILQYHHDRSSGKYDYEIQRLSSEVSLTLEQTILLFGDCDHAQWLKKLDDSRSVYDDLRSKLLGRPYEVQKVLPDQDSLERSESVRESTTTFDQ